MSGLKTLVPVTMKRRAVTDRPYEKALSNGVASLTTAELLAIQIKCGVRGVPALDLGHHLIARFGLADLAQVTVEDLCRCPGIGPVKAITLQAAFELGRRVALAPYCDDATAEVVTSPETIGPILCQKLGALDHEECVVLLLNARNRVMRSETIASGGVAALSLSPRDLFRAALRANAVKMIVAHNHPSGDATPSDADIEVTRVLTTLGTMMGVTLLDHIVVARSTWTSVRRCMGC